MLRTVSGAAAALAVFALPLGAAAQEAPPERSAAEEAPAEPLPEVTVKRAPWAGKAVGKVKAQEPAPQAGLLLPAVQKVREAATEEEDDTAAKDDH